MAEPSRGIDFSAGQEPIKAPHVPIPGQQETSSKDDEGGHLPPSVVLLGKVIAILATIAGIIFGVWQIVQSNRQYQKDLFETEAKSKREMMQIQQQISSQNLQAQQEIEKQRTEQKKADFQKIEEERKIADDKTAQAKAEQAKADEELSREQKEWEARKTQEDRNSAAEIKRAEAEELKQVQTEITKLRISATSAESVLAASAVAEHLSSKTEAKQLALNALESRIAKIPTPAEISIIFDALPDAGVNGMDVAIRSNRFAWKLLLPAIKSEVVKGVDPERGNLGGAAYLRRSITSQLEPLHRGQHDQQVERIFSSVVSDMVPDHIVTLSVSETYLPPLESVVAILVSSRRAIEKMVTTAEPNSRINLDDCFLPYFTPDGPTQASAILLRTSFIMGADLRPLSQTNADTALEFTSAYSNRPISVAPLFAEQHTIAKPYFTPNRPDEVSIKLDVDWFFEKVDVLITFQQLLRLYPNAKSK